MLLSAAVVPVSAAGYSDTASVRKSDGFSTAWEKTKTYMVGSDIIGYMIYGYNTDWINEDYVWTMGKECCSTASVFRDGYDSTDCSGFEAAKDSYSKIEVTHKTYYVYYKVKFSASYSKVTSFTMTSNVK